MGVKEKNEVTEGPLRNPATSYIYPLPPGKNKAEQQKAKLNLGASHSFRTITTGCYLVC